MLREKAIKSVKGKLVISGLILSLGLSGCSFQLNKDKSNNSNNKVLIEMNDEYDYNLDQERIDDIMGFSKDVKDKKYLEYTYFIDSSTATDATLAHVIEEKTITNDGKMFDGKTEMTSRTFREDVIQPIVLPIAFTLFNVDDMADLADAYATCNITCKKMVTIEGDILYYFDSTAVFNKFAERTIGLDIIEGDTIHATALYKLNPNGKFDLLYRNQEGFKSDSDDVVAENYNNTKEIVIPIEESVLSEMDGKYSEKEALETVKEYKKY